MIAYQSYRRMTLTVLHFEITQESHMVMLVSTLRGLRRSVPLAAPSRSTRSSWRTRSRTRS
jgi:hypothetical protein